MNYLLFFICLVFTFFYTSIVEYGAHRWIMHIPIFGKNDLWRKHSIEHHKNHRNDVNIELPPIHSLVLGLPLFFFCFFLGWPWAVTVVVLAFLHATTWTVLHSTYHGVGHTQWIKSWWYYKIWERHHLLHHVHWNMNYGAVFIWTDYLFGTKMK